MRALLLSSVVLMLTHCSPSQQPELPPDAAPGSVYIKEGVTWRFAAGTSQTEVYDHATRQWAPAPPVSDVDSLTGPGNH